VPGVEAPLADTMIAAGATVVAVVAATSPAYSGAKCVLGSSCAERTSVDQPFLITFVAIGAFESASAIYGFVHRSSCSARTEALAAR
jgi:hypothetical protein